ncbi:acyl-CoA thioesterase domain-containing protein [Rhodococcus sp. TAF43]|uniref:acyl-CoA thioesterase domain-containing protein n=1 Tax=unclassified Rhodococcus (in: high G+C Gram-positive bacteria) TaxID=192944 RepID=UPI000E0A03CD|nr:acyl-CoA thioesterase domain-containing protein [Rhodococcus sp. AG1013]RDI25812.1 thioesterase superfamily protein [Rhodococcus sp. AG1013]
MNESIAFLTRDGDGFSPLPLGISKWSSDMINGPALTGLLARDIENDHGAEGFVPARLTVDLFRPARAERIDVVTRSVRTGNRIRVADGELLQKGEPVARATVVFLRRGVQPPGELWTRPESPQPPPLSLLEPLQAPSHPWIGSDDHPAGWSPSLGDHEGASRKRIWQYQVPVVAGEEPSPFVRAAMVGETTSLMTNWGTEGIGFINADLTLALSRLPEGPEIGLEADNHISVDGISIGSTTMFDRLGPIGTCIVSALSNAQRQLGFAR